MPRLSHRIAAVASFAVLTIAGTRPAFAEDSPSGDVLPPLPAPQDEAAPRSNTVTLRGDTPIVQAQTVQTNHVDTVVVAQPGSTVTVPANVTVHSRSQREYAPDPGRKAALIASPIVFGVGALVAGIAYLSAQGQTECTAATDANGNWHENCQKQDGKVGLWTYNVIVAGVPSAPRWVVGDVMGALVYTGARTASVVIASTVDWGHDNSAWLGPFMLGVLAPLTLGIVDLATTPHREDLAPKDDGRATEARAPSGFRISAIAPTTLTDPTHKVNGGMLNLSASF
jgi:hypothetical protein